MPYSKNISFRKHIYIIFKTASIESSRLNKNSVVVAQKRASLLLAVEEIKRGKNNTPNNRVKITNRRLKNNDLMIINQLSLFLTLMLENVI